MDPVIVRISQSTRESTEKPGSHFRISKLFVVLAALALILLNELRQENKYLIRTNAVGVISSSQNNIRRSTTNTNVATDKSNIREESSRSQPAQPRFAYCFVIAGCDPNNPSYRNYLYNVMIAAKQLRQLGSKADVVVLVQMDFFLQIGKNDLQTKRQEFHQTGNGRINGTLPKELMFRLPPQDQQMLQKMNIIVKYIPPHPQQSFHRTMLDKFRVWSLVEYDRVLFLDGDILPIQNMDYIMQASMKHSESEYPQLPQLKEAIVVKGGVAPYNGGFFVIKPNMTEYKQIDHIIKTREKEARNMPRPFFNYSKGWGHQMGGIINGTSMVDKWVGYRQQGTNWKFNGAYTDQGLLYYWLRYVKRSLSLIIDRAGVVQNWDYRTIPDAHYDDDAPMILQESLKTPFSNLTVTSLPANEYGSCRPGKHPPASGYVHLTSKKKPWLKGPPKELITFENKNLSCRHFWFYELQQLNTKLDLGLDLSPTEDKNETDEHLNQTESTKPTLGFFAFVSSLKTASADLLEPLYD